MIEFVALVAAIGFFFVSRRQSRTERELADCKRRLARLEDRRSVPPPLPTETVGKIGGNVFIHHHERRPA